ncbi:MAG: hypothetical protein COV55_01115 [Candidatus Komeilibacteria bacterium CG11_big_fil_rev_8_21_14_0_20_36_20]|uniref:Uncharacterized protein n=1 Tax=Candidatus Komeilibacteria bacterium CG11_big_fil_rev_8_21_14_0_20_36_20 TaxID=1974477 RepID=A0A2H0NDN6_9BACT|nr:MAG: hypothetical protein COV55_01115 [Candidatus Komeilibacteria bacterium CG11_big_fil_rev_8_21_14_0_20_36_20]PIR81380.1 MAG: hypothetical protein COU21_04085 [Candidatus Komeilibacteria bacterium CG10_big_fil_rev_8_21_14_0_10_36_65]PJC55105.1 MAG: hypothetical protein CO027_03040 [Candidatus Komeilibacteria bacterium CG_4_9_14_0_2_um_filter_36_13]
MYKYLVLFFNPLILLVGFWLFFYYQSGLVWLVVLSLLAILLTGRILSQRYFWKFKLLWFNLMVVYIAELLFLLLLTSETVRYLSSFILVLAWLVLWILLKKYFQVIKDKDTGNKDYLAFSRFFYYLGFWFLSSSLYSLIIFLNLSALSCLFLMLLATFLWMQDIFKSAENINKYYVWFAMFLLAQALAALYFLPVSFYIAGTIATLWFFFIIDNIVSQLKYFQLYLGLFLLSIFLLLGTSIIT